MEYHMLNLPLMHLLQSILDHTNVRFSISILRMRILRKSIDKVDQLLSLYLIENIYNIFGRQVTALRVGVVTRLVLVFRHGLHQLNWQYAYLMPPIHYR